MSTISDALKKAQKNRSAMMSETGIKPVPEIQPRKEEFPAPLPGPQPRGNGTNLVVAGLAIAVVCIILAVQLKTSSPQSILLKGEAGAASLPKSTSLKEGGGAGAGVVAQSSKSDEPQVLPLPMPPPPPRENLPTLYGTFYSEVNPVAIINGSTVKEGEAVGDYTIVKILPRSVLLKSSGGEVELKLK